MSKPKTVSPFWFKVAMNLYPPYLFSRTKLLYVSEDFKQMKIKIKKSLLNRNLSGTIFGGTMFSASDPFFALMYWQNFAKQYDMNVQVWLKSAKIKYIKPATKDIYIDFELKQEEIEAAKKDIAEKGKHNKEHIVELKNKQGELYAIVNINTYVGLKN